MINLTYVSESRIAAGEAKAEIDAILACSIDHNGRAAITGALLFTGSRFVQTLEGSAAVVDALMACIVRDPRHAALVVVDRHVVGVRNFSGWTLTYDGPSLFVARTVARGLAAFHAGRPGDVAQLLRLMIEFGAAPPLRRA